MAKVDTNVVSLAYAREIVAGTAALTGWRDLEPNEINEFGANITATAREPISNRLQRRKGSVTDLDAGVSFSADITVDGFLDWIGPAIFALRKNENVWRLPVSAVTGGSNDEYTIPALDAAQAAKFSG